MVFDVAELQSFNEKSNDQYLGTRGSYSSDYIESDKYLGDLSSNQHVLWNEKIIEEFINRWNWQELSKNDGIIWNQIMIDRFTDHIDFSELSFSGTVVWTKEFIHKYRDVLDFKNLSHNNKIVWTVDLLEEFEDDLNWLGIAKCGQLTNEIIKAFPQKWRMKTTENHMGRRNSDGYYWYDTTHILWEYVCQNKNVTFDEEILSMFLDELPLFRLDSQRIKVSSKFINKNWNYQKSETTRQWENYDGWSKNTIEDVKLIEQIKDAEITDLSIKTFMENEPKWNGVLCGDSFLNSSIMKLLSEY